MERRKNLSKRVEQLTLELVKVRSVVGTTDELDISNKVYDLFRQMPLLE